MRRIVRPKAGIYLALALMLAAGCNRKENQRLAVESATIEEQSSELQQTVNAADPKAAPQLLKGFYGIENNSWRWTAKEFSVLLPPPDKPAGGARLVLKINVPEPVIQQFGKVSLQATASGVALAPETYSANGAQEYTRELPQEALQEDSIRVDFQLDRAMPPGNGDKRVLGLVFNSVAIEPK